MKDRTERLISEFFTRYGEMSAERENIYRAIDLCVSTAARDKKILICGNGGSAADSEHISGELLKGFLLKRPIEGQLREKLIAEFGSDEPIKVLQRGVQALPLPSFSAAITAFMNDCSPDYVFAQEVLSLGREGDLLICLSTSGNSSNILKAAKAARAANVKTLALTGESGGKLLALCDVTVKAPSKETFIIQEYHLPIYHLLCAVVESELFEA